MNLITKRILLLCFCILFIVANINAQSSQQNSENGIALNRMINIYHSWAGSHDPVYNGREYDRYAFYINSGIPYFITDTLSNAKLVYDGIQYDQVPLIYDLVIDELITKSYGGKKLIKLVKQKVDSFSLYGARFIRINADKNIPQGYYQLMYDSNTQVLKKEVKRIEDDVRYGEQLQRHIKSKVTYYVKENDQYRQVKNKSAIKSYHRLTQ